MKIENVEQSSNEALSRREVTADITYDGATPQTGAVRDVLANSLKADAKLLVVKHIYPRFGMRAARVLAHVYESEGQLVRLEKKHAEAMKKEAESAKKKAEEKKDVKESQEKKETKEEKESQEKKETKEEKESEEKKETKEVKESEEKKN